MGWRVMPLLWLRLLIFIGDHDTGPIVTSHKKQFRPLCPTDYPMALMHLEDVETLEAATDGEKQVFRFLRPTFKKTKAL
jgi:hypothetical protein